MMSVLPVLILGCGFWHVWGSLGKCGERVVRLTKPLPMLFIMITVWLGGMEALYTKMVFAGLVFSLIGDLFLLFPERFFIHGLLAFLLAHILYIFAFAQRGLEFSVPVSILIGCYALGMTIFLWRSLGKALQIPVLVYLSVISGMGIFAISLWFAQPNSFTFNAAAGAVLFMISDSILACKKFKNGFLYDQALIMATYFAAQWLIALSV